MDGAKERNHLLAAVMAEADVSNKGLAAQVHADAKRAGLHISPNHKSVRLWLEGSQPRDKTVPYIVSALRRKIGRKVTAAEIGFTDPSAGASDADVVNQGVRYPAESSQSVELLDKLTTADLEANTAVTSADWAPDAAPAVITDYLFARPLWVAPEELDVIARTDVAARILTTVRIITDLGFRFGGGHVRQLLLSYWKSEIVPELRKDYPEPIRRELLGAAADAAEVLGWSAYDDGRHGAAQRYFIQGLRLSREAGDPLMGGQILSNLSHQANYLGYFDSALRLARAAQSATVVSASATVNAMFLAMEARALASLGDVRGCIAALGQAEKSFDRRNPASDPDWIGYFDELELAGEAAHCFRDLGLSKETMRFAGQAIDPVRTPARTRSFISMVSAAGELRAGNLDGAVALAIDSVRTAGPMKSDRYRRYLRDFYASIPATHASGIATRELAELLRTSYPTSTLIGAD
ncbi:MAG: hypothetical protein ACRDRH_09040 [Pseudonocardia sp.]